jgi:hypothetical protein
MSQEIYDGRSGVYKSGVVGTARRPDYAWPAVSENAGSGGLPWPFGRGASPYNPNKPYVNPAPVEPYEPQGPPLEGQGSGKPGGLAGLFAGMSPKDIAALIAALGGTIGGALSKPNDLTPTSATTDPAMAEVLALMRGRLQKSEPMFDSALAMANGLLPTAYQRGNFTPYTPPGSGGPATGGPSGGSVPPNEREY